MITIKDLSFRYKESTSLALSHVNLEVKDGECILLCGKSGCGKTTLTRILNGMIPDFYNGELSGSIQINGINPSTCPMYEIARTVGTVFQNPRTQFYTMNTTSEIAFGCENLGCPVAEIKKRVQKSAQKLHIESLLDRDIFKLSGGEKQVIAMAGIYAVDPTIYVLDEPTSSLDFSSIRALQSILAYLKAQGKTIIIAEHRMWFLKDLADRVIYLENGKFLQTYTMKQCEKLSFEERIRTGIRPINLCDLKSEMKKEKATSKETASVLTLQDLSFSYAHTPLLDIRSADFSAGRIIAIVGPNGAGKSTLVSVLCGLLKNQKGTISLDGMNLSAKKRVRLSYMVMQEVNHQLFTDSVKEEVALGASGGSKEKLNRVLTDLDIASLKDRHPMTCSGGQKQRIAIAAAVFCGKRILIFDEPTSGLDYAHMEETVALLRRLVTPDTFIFIISHDLEFILGACDEVIQMEHGVIKDTYPLNETGLMKLQGFFGIDKT